MRKQELVHTHALLVLVRRELAEREEVAVPAGAFDAYDSHDVDPTSLTERKDEHEEALERLSNGLYAVVSSRSPVADAQPTPQVPEFVPQ